jgi:hypothetical protein
MLAEKMREKDLFASLKRQKMMACEKLFWSIENIAWEHKIFGCTPKYIILIKNRHFEILFIGNGCL